MREFVKVNPSFTERLLFLITGLIDKKYLINTEQRIIVTKDEVIQDTEFTIDKGYTFDGGEIKIDIPFFDLDTSKAKSNL